MVTFQRILCPLDFSDFSSRAYDYAQSLARHYRAKLFAAHVIAPMFAAYPTFTYPEVASDLRQHIRAYAEEQLGDFVRAHTSNDFPVETSVCEGPITESILAFAAAQQADLIVMGTHGRQGFDHLLLGSVTEKILRKARCPVLAVRKPDRDFAAPAGSGDAVQLQRILFATDFSQHADHALGYALSLAQEYGAELTLLHVLEEIPLSWDLSAVSADVVQRLEKSLTPDVRAKCDIKSRLRVGRPYQEIVRAALENRVDLAVLGVRGRNALDLALFGSTTHRVIQQAPCPVLAVNI